MKITLTAVILYFISPVIFAASFSSGDCQNQQLKSQAQAFIYNNQQLVVASSDFTWNSDSSCHSIVWLGQTHELKLIINDWATGLSLFEPIQGLEKLKTLKVETPQILGKFIFNKVSGSILSVNSDRHSFARPNSFIEFIVNKNMNRESVGSALISYDDPDAIVGIVSSQYLRTLGGHASSVVRWVDGPENTACEQESSNACGRFFAYPAESVRNWIDQVLSGQIITEAKLDSHSLWANEQYIIKWQGLQFLEMCPPTHSSGEDLEYPIGGVDPFGIGGGTKYHPACKFEVSLDLESGSNSPTIRSEWASEIVEYLESGQEVSIHLGYERESNKLISYSYSSIGLFQRDFLFTNKNTALVISPFQVNPEAEELNKLAHQLRTMVRKYPFENKKNYFRHRAYLTSLLLEGPHWKYVITEDLEKIKKDSPWDEYDKIIGQLINLRNHF